MSTVLMSWEDMTLRSRVSLILGVLLIVGLTVTTFLWLTNEEYQVLFTDLETRDAASVIEELERQKIDYKLEDDGAKIMVAASEVHQVRLKLMGSGLPLGGGVGFEIFDDSDFGMTEFAQQVNYQRALEGELTRTIMSLKEVKYARVHLVMSEKGLFQEDDSPPSASVTLFMQAEYRNAERYLDEQQIIGIQRLVSSAVPNLKAGQVTVTDQDGMTLSRGMPEQAGMAAVSGRLQQKQSVENYLTSKVNEVLTHTFGAHQAMVSVDVDLDFNEVKRTNENVVTPSDGQSGVLRRRETHIGSGDENSGDGNVTTEIEYRLGRTVEQIVEMPGRIMKLSVGVMVPAETTPARREELRQLVMMTVGLDKNRGDEIAVYTMNPSAIVVPASDAAKAFEMTAPVLAVEQVQESTFKSLVQQWVNRHPMAVGAIAVVIVLLLLSILTASLRGRNKAGGEKPSIIALPELSQMEREQALMAVREWLDKTDSPAIDSAAVGKEVA